MDSSGLHYSFVISARNLKNYNFIFQNFLGSHNIDVPSQSLSRMNKEGMLTKLPLALSNKVITLTVLL